MPNPRKWLDRYLLETVNYGGEPSTRADIIRDMQQKGYSRVEIDYYLMGLDKAREATHE